MKELISCLLIGLAVLLSLFPLYGADYKNPAPFFHTLTVDDGLPSNAVLSIHKDRNGFLWFGTEKGLSRFDGTTVKTYATTWNQEICAIEEKDDYNLLIGTVSSLYEFNRKTHALKPVDKFPIAHVRKIERVSADKFVIATDIGIYILKEGKIEKAVVGNGQSSSNDITGIARQDSLNYWMSTADGVVHLDLKSGRTMLFKMPEEMEKGNHFMCVTIKNDTVYLGGFNKGLFRYDIKRHSFSEIEGFNHNLIQTVECHGNILYVGTNGRGLRMVDTTGKYLGNLTVGQSPNGGLKSNTITAFLYDDGLYWTGTQFGGISYSPRSKDKFLIYSSGPFNSADHRVASFYLYPDGAKLIGTREGLYYFDDTRDIRNFYSIGMKSPGLRSDIITFIAKIGKEVLVGTYGGGISRFNRDKLILEDISDNDLFRYGCVFQFVADDDENMWVATQEGLFHTTVSGEVLAHYTKENSSLPTSIVRRVCLDHNRRLWIGTKFGLVLYDTKTGRSSVDNIEIPGRDHIQYLYNDNSGNTFICGSASLSIVDSSLKVIKHFDASSWLNGNKPKSVKEVGDGIYWIATDREIVKYSLRDSVLQKYQRQDGLPSMPFNFNSLISPDSVIYFTSEGGLAYASVRDSEETYKGDIAPVIVSCEADDIQTDIMEIEWKDGFEIPANTAMVSFRVSPMDYTLPYTNSFEYRLEGYDNDWRKLTGSNEIVYRNLGAGDYVLEVRNVDTGQSSRLKVKVNRSYIWIITIVAMILAIAIVVGFFSYRIWKLQMRIRHERKIFATVNDSKESTKKKLESKPEHEELLDRLLLYMEEKRPYTNVKLGINQVAEDLETTGVELSKLLNVRMSVNWATFVNTYRVNEVKRCIEEGQLSRLTLNALSEKCGFGSKTTFYRVFKSIVGMTPLEYCQTKGISISDSE